jgi:predicted amidohydrolase
MSIPRFCLPKMMLFNIVSSIMKIAIAQIKSVLGDFEQNLQKHLEFIRKALENKADLVIFPELSLTGYSLKDLTNEVAVRLDHPRLSPLISRSQEIDIVVGLVEESDEFLYFNTALYLSGGKIVHAHRKIYLPTYGMFEEGRHFAMGSSLAAFDTRLGRTGIIICEDAWHSVCPLILNLKGATSIINIANGTARGIGKPGQIGSANVWEGMNTFYAGNHSLYFIFVNRVGVEDGVVFWGGSEIIDPFGARVAKGSYLEEEILFGDIDIDVVRRSRVKSPLLRDEKIDFCLREFQYISMTNRPGDKHL